jgi:hypothetical protein
MGRNLVQIAIDARTGYSGNQHFENKYRISEQMKSLSHIWG